MRYFLVSFFRMNDIWFDTNGIGFIMMDWKRIIHRITAD